MKKKTLKMLHLYIFKCAKTIICCEGNFILMNFIISNSLNFISYTI